ncbi:hypothetical protein J14TS2_44560 [Bacillus sp. J14TS2]|uniref:thermonuclease family protein n=1 Tax=Bacillus sp. J14TS2 TaxID=2807188 RepID=UPI001B0DBD94|nr:thermonuclease family protein [Bacillus sp. J14TS2]GIN73981.1 hypothetical protein J14TS2_44560 [Bacillus sp. J14TS2]
MNMILAVMFVVCGFILWSLARVVRKKGFTWKRMGSLFLSFFLLIGSGFFLVDKSGIFPGIGTSGTTEQIPVELVKVIDGDTIKIIYQGQEQNVRYLLIDTPETSHPRLGKQPFGEEAKKRNAELIENGKLTIEFDVGERFDKYSRLLAYIYVDGESVQEKLLEEGLARVAYVYPPNTRYLTPFEKAQKKAQKKEAGIWSLENYARDDGFHADSAESESQTSADEDCQIKGNIGSSGKIYHTPDSPWYEQTKPEVMFCTEEEAVEAGFRAPK